MESPKTVKANKDNDLKYRQGIGGYFNDNPEYNGASFSVGVKTESGKTEEELEYFTE